MLVSLQTDGQTDRHNAGYGPRGTTRLLFGVRGLTDVGKSTDGLTDRQT